MKIVFGRIPLAKEKLPKCMLLEVLFTSSGYCLDFIQITITLLKKKKKKQKIYKNMFLISDEDCLAETKNLFPTLLKLCSLFYFAGNCLVKNVMFSRICFIKE